MFEFKVLIHFVPTCPGGIVGFLYSSTVSIKSSYVIRKFDPPTPSLDVVITIKKDLPYYTLGSFKWRTRVGEVSWQSGVTWLFLKSLFWGYPT